jgi:putative thioredoxin
MTQQPFSTAALRGAVDLGALAAAGQRKAAAAAGGSGGGYVVEVTEADFQSAVIDRSMTVPVIVDLWTARAAQSQQISTVLDSLAAEYAGRFLVARVDIDTNPALVQAFQVQTLPFVVAVIKGQPLPLIADVLPESAVRQVLDKLLEVAGQNGVTGRVGPDGRPADGDDTGAGVDGTDAEAAAAPPEPPLPPLHQEAYDAIERDDLEAAIAAYQQALRENPADDLAAVGLINVQLIQRVTGLDPEAAVATADAAPDDTPAQLRAADAEFATGQLDAAFDRLVEAVRRRSGDEREEVRSRLVDLFALLGPDAPEVRRARIALTNALF